MTHTDIERQRRYTAKNRDKINARQREYRARTKDKQKQYKDKRKYKTMALYNEYCIDTKCVICGITDQRILAWHHIDESTKIDTISNMLCAHRAWPVLKAELDKCIRICHNCHILVHKYGVVIPPE